VVLRVRFESFKKEAEPTIRELKFIVKRIRKSPLSIVGIIIILTFVAIAILAPILAPPPEGWYDPYMIPRDGFSVTPRPPSPEHLFGTAEGQYDIYYGCIWGTRTAFRVGLIVVGCTVLMGIAIGSISGYYGGKIDEIFMRLTDVIYAFPGIVLVMVLVVILGPSLESVMMAIILVGWPTYARLVRGEVLRIKQEDFVEAAKAMGCSDFRVIVRHVLPNAIFPLLAVATLDMGSIVLTVAAFSFLGLGAPIGYADWGQMIALSRNWIIGTPVNPYEYWYTFIIPGIFIFTFVLGWGLLGDAFRDILDPMLRRR